MPHLHPPLKDDDNGVAICIHKLLFLYLVSLTNYSNSYSYFRVLWILWVGEEDKLNSDITTYVECNNTLY